MNMKRQSIINFLLCALAAIVMFSVPGCLTPTTPAKGKKTNVPPAPDSGPVVAGHKEREARQDEATDTIDETVEGTPVEKPVKEQTAVIRQANKDASAAQIEAMAGAFSVTVGAQAKEIARLEALVAKLEKTIAELTAKLEDFGRKVVIYTLNGLGGLFILLAVGAGILTKSPAVVAWPAGGSIFCFGAARFIGHWLFPWACAGAILCVVAGAVIYALKHFERKRAAAAIEAGKQRLLKVGDDVISAVEDARATLKKPSAEAVDAILKADTTEKALAAVAKIKAEMDEQLSKWVTKDDGTRALVDQRRTELQLA